MIERLLLDRIDAKPGGLSVAREDDFLAHALAHEAERTLPVVQAAEARAEVALDPAVGELVLPAPRFVGSLGRVRHVRPNVAPARARATAVYGAMRTLFTSTPAAASTAVCTFTSSFTPSRPRSIIASMSLRGTASPSAVP